MASLKFIHILAMVAVVLSCVTVCNGYRRAFLTRKRGRATQNQYCSINARNTLCLYRTSSVGSKCKRLYLAKVTQADKEVILKVHNELRRKVALGKEKRGINGAQPPASNMREMTWDDELAVMAQTWAQQCNFAHDANRNVGRFVVGQNLAIAFSTAKFTSPDWARQITNWFNEVNDMRGSFVSKFPSSPGRVIGHYTQGAWATTYKIGCGITSYYDNTWQGPFPFKMYYVCNYGPSGNYINSPIYKIGRAGSACPTGTVPRNGLCS